MFGAQSAEVVHDGQERNALKVVLPTIAEGLAGPVCRSPFFSSPTTMSSQADNSVAAAAADLADAEQVVDAVMRQVTRAIAKAATGSPLDSETADILRLLTSPKLAEMKRILSTEVPNLDRWIF
ncbi:hypothetical protein MSAN_02095900 [Mycena sanguinolenta]|uniref:Uncharacterized protein n=1 Tax=Mycena sanguinolenta TaxID=230812 RepID=A0A8H7CMF7_9AGAR|nr:hypothetical protein MSAN_02095900 [Mycena sanguinolenta]